MGEEARRCGLSCEDHGAHFWGGAALEVCGYGADADPEAAVVQIGTLLLSTISLLHLHAVEWPEGVDTREWRRRRLLEAIRMVRVSLAVDEAD